MNGNEADLLAQEILALTATIPRHILNSGSANSVKRFKEIATKARAVASLRVRNLSKLREAASLIRPFYRQQGE